MGTDARYGRRALVLKVEECVKQVNTMTGLATEVREANNGLAATVGTDMASVKATLKDLQSRAEAQRVWLRKVEDFSRSRDERVSLLRSNVDAAVRVFIGLTFMDRLRLFFFGTLPVTEDFRDFAAGWLHTPPTREPEAPEKATVIDVDAPAKSLTYRELAALEAGTNEAGPLQGYIPHISRGPAVLP